MTIVQVNLGILSKSCTEKLVKYKGNSIGKVIKYDSKSGIITIKIYKKYQKMFKEWTMLMRYSYSRRDKK